MLKRISAPTVTGQSTLAVTRPAFPAASQSVGTLTSSAYQYQPPMFLLYGSNGVFAVIPCLAGETPVTSVVWLGYVTVGVTPTTPVAYAPSFTRRRRFGIFSPRLSAWST